MVYFPQTRPARPGREMSTFFKGGGAFKEGGGGGASRRGGGAFKEGGGGLVEGGGGVVLLADGAGGRSPR